MTEYDITPQGKPCLECGIPLISYRRFRALPYETRKQLLRQRSLNGRATQGLCCRCHEASRRDGTYEPAKRIKYIKDGAFRWPEHQIALTGGQWVVRRGIRVWEPVKRRTGAASR